MQATQPADDNFLLVGIGASAGGVQALRDFFANLPPDTGMAYVVIVHLSQEHESSLHTILQANARIPVMQVQETVKVEPDHVYVIPPAKHLEMVDGHISLTGKQIQPLKQVDVAALVASLVKDLKASIDAKKAHVSVGALPVLPAYATELRLLFQNLISNALKFQQQGQAPEIHITAEPRGKGWHFLVTDNGIGIEAKHHERVFEIFQRLHSQEEFAGNGIGLTHCKKIVELHGGEIWLESQVGRGSTFHFTIEK